MEKIVLSAQPREKKGKGAAHALRREGRIPAVIYGAGGPTPIALDKKELARAIRSGTGGSTVFSVSMPGKAETRAILKEYQRDPISGELTHADLLELSGGRPVHVSIPVVLVGDSAGVRAGGILEHLAREIEVECLPDRIPERIEVDVSGLAVASSIHVADIRFAEGVRPITPPEQVIAVVAVPTLKEKLAEAAPAAEGAKPEAA